MGRIRIRICMKNSEYGMKLARYMSGRHNADIEVELLTDWKDKTEFEREDVVLSDDGEYLDRLSCRSIRMVRTPEEQGERCIFMYQKRELLYEELLKKMGIGQKQEYREGDKQIVAVFSPEGGDDKTVLALTYASGLSQGHAVLYVNFCGFPALFEGAFERGDKEEYPGITELMLKENTQSFVECLKQAAYPLGNIHVVKPVDHYKDLLDFSIDDLRRFMKNLRDQTVYDKVVLEVGQIFEYTLDLLEFADEILIPKEEGILAAVRRSVLQRYCNMEGRSELWKRIRFEENKANKPETESDVMILVGGEGDI